MVKPNTTSKRHERNYHYQKRRVQEMNSGLLRRSVRFMVKPDKKWNGFVNPPVMMKPKRHYQLMAANVPDEILANDPLSEDYADRDELINDPACAIKKKSSSVMSMSDFPFDYYGFSDTSRVKSIQKDEMFTKILYGQLAEAVSHTSVVNTSHSGNTITAGSLGTSYTIEGLLTKIAKERTARYTAETKAASEQLGRLKAEATVATLTVQLVDQTYQKQTIKALQSRVALLTKTLENLQSSSQVSKSYNLPVVKNDSLIKTDIISTPIQAEINVKTEPIDIQPQLKLPCPKITVCETTNKIPEFYIGLTLKRKPRITYYYDENGHVRKFFGTTSSTKQASFFCSSCKVSAKLFNNEFYLCKNHLAKCKTISSETFISHQLNLRKLYKGKFDDNEIFKFCDSNRLNSDRNMISKIL